MLHAEESAYQQRETSWESWLQYLHIQNPLRILTPSLLSPRSRIKTDSICLAMESPSQEDKGVPDSQHLLVSNRSNKTWTQTSYLRVCDILWSSSMLKVLIKIQNKKYRNHKWESADFDPRGFQILELPIDRIGKSQYITFWELWNEIKVNKKMQILEKILWQEDATGAHRRLGQKGHCSFS